MALYARLARDVELALDGLVAAGSLPAGLHRGGVTLEPPRDARNGDFASNAALVLARRSGRTPEELTDVLAAAVARMPDVEHVSIARQGFVNMTLRPRSWHGEVATILARGDAYGCDPRISLPDATDAGSDVSRLATLLERPGVPATLDLARAADAVYTNPVFTIHYAHARIAGAVRHAGGAGIFETVPDLSQLETGDMALLTHAAQFPRIVAAALQSREPGRIAGYLSGLASSLHKTWPVGVAMGVSGLSPDDNAARAAARLFLAAAIGQIIRNGLAFLGVRAVEEIQ